jgi:membrane protease YdiL (CAAX protease family)
MYIQQAYKGYNDWWRYLATLILLLLSQFIGSIALIVVAMAQNTNVSEFAATKDVSTLGIDQNLTLFLMLIPFILSFFALVLAMRYLHGHSFKNIFTAASKFRWKNFFFALIAWFLLLGVSDLINYMLHPDYYSFSFNLKVFIPLLLISIFFIPLQAGAEELYFRGNLLQGSGILTQSRVFAVLFSSIAFGLMHFSNPEVGEFGFGISMSYYIGFGLFMALLVIFDGGLEMAMAVHIINNIYGAVIVGYSGSVLKTESLFKLNTHNMGFMLLAFLFAVIIFLVIARRMFNWAIPGLLFKPVEKVFSDKNSLA